MPKLKENEAKILALHRVIEEDFTPEQVRIMLVGALERRCNYDYDKVAEILNSFYIMFKRNTL